jgi:hypothetical protein
MTQEREKPSIPGSNKVAPAGVVADLLIVNLTALMKTPLRILILIAAFPSAAAFGQTTGDYDAAIREATERYRGDIPTGHDRILLREQTGTEGIVGDRARALKHYFEKADIYKPYLEEIEKTPPGPARDHLIEDLRNALEGKDKKAP